MRALLAYVLAAAAVAAIAALTVALEPVLGLTSCALLFLLPVLLAAVRGGTGPGLFAAISGALAYNFFLLPPRLSFHIHGAENFVSVLVLAMVALVVSRLAHRLKANESQASARAEASDELATLSAELAGEPEQAIARGLDWFDVHYGKLRLIEGPPPEEDAGFSSLDLSAAAWSIHNGDMTGHGTPIMPVADWTFIPLAPRRRLDRSVAALARPANGTTRSEAQLAHLAQLMLTLGQACDRAALARASHERDRLEAGERLRRAFLASLAHDFRTPLTVISGRLGPLAATSSEAAEALAATRRLDRTMDDLIAAARLEDGSLSPRAEALDLIDVVAAAVQDLTSPDGIDLDRQVPADLPFVRGDATLLRHVLANLIDNALRHARSHVSLIATSASAGVLLAVEDDGPGIPADERTRIFDRFARLEGDDRGGSGLGLAIVKGFAEAMGMTIAVEQSRLGGARFVLTLPAASSPAP